MGLFKSREQKLERAALQLEDMVEDRDKWGFADTPSERAGRVRDIKRQIRKIHLLGGDPHDHTSYSHSYRLLVQEALKEQ